MEEKNKENPVDRAMTIYSHMVKMGYISQDDADTISRIIEEGKGTSGIDGDALSEYVSEGENNIRYAGFAFRGDYIKLFARQVVDAAKQGKALIFPLSHRVDADVSEKLVTAAKKMNASDVDRMFGYENETAINNQDERFLNHFYRSERTMSMSTINRIRDEAIRLGLAKKQPSEVKDPIYGRKRMFMELAKKQPSEVKDPNYNVKRGLDDENLYADKKTMDRIDDKYSRRRGIDEAGGVHSEGTGTESLVDRDVLSYVHSMEDEPLLKIINSRISGYV